jgi:hypothetical protein
VVSRPTGRVGSLKLLQDLHNRQKLSDPPPLRFLIFIFLGTPSLMYFLLMVCCFYETYWSSVAVWEGLRVLRGIEKYRRKGTIKKRPTLVWNTGAALRTR